MRNFQDTFETRNRSFISAFLICMTVPLKPTERAQILLKNGSRDFQNSSPYERLACFYVTIQSVKVLNVVNTLTLIQIFWKTKIFFKKLEDCFLVETTKIENTSFPFKTARSEANAKTNRMVTTKWTYHIERSFPSNCLIFLENLFQF